MNDSTRDVILRIYTEIGRRKGQNIENFKSSRETCFETQAFGALAEDMEIRRWILLAYPEAFGGTDEEEPE